MSTKNHLLKDFELPEGMNEENYCTLKWENGDIRFEFITFAYPHFQTLHQPFSSLDDIEVCRK